MAFLTSAPPYINHYQLQSIRLECSENQGYGFRIAPYWSPYVYQFEDVQYFITFSPLIPHWEVRPNRWVAGALWLSLCDIRLYSSNRQCTAILSHHVILGCFQRPSLKQWNELEIWKQPDDKNRYISIRMHRSPLWVEDIMNMKCSEPNTQGQ